MSHFYTEGDKVDNTFRVSEVAVGDSEERKALTGYTVVSRRAQ